MLRHRPILVGSAALGVLGAALAAGLLGLGRVQAPLFGWCIAAAAYVALSLLRGLAVTPAQLRHEADLADEGRWVVLVATLAASLASLVAVLWDLAAAPAEGRATAVALTLATVGLSWMFVHLLFAHHYAHEYWRDGRGLVFPGNQQPDLWEFLYFAGTIGMAMQVSDVVTNSAAMRRLVLAHGLLSFVYNAAILGAAVNVGLGLVQP